MPCQGPSAYEIAAMERGEQKRLIDRLTRENDELREKLLTLLSGGTLTKPESNEILASQIAHRKEDLKRLKQQFKKNKDALRYGLVGLADPKKPLEPQLGFNPDDF